MFINMDLGGVSEPKPVAPGRYDLTISTAEYREAKNDIRVSIGIDGHADAPNISHFIALPKAEDDASKVQFKKLMLKRFLAQFYIAYDDNEGFAVEDFPGAAGTAQVNLSEPDDSGAVYNRLQLDRMAAE
jgi:hypothetical protein